MKKDRKSSVTPYVAVVIAALAAVAFRVWEKL
jgi:hypothetical protein